MDKLQIGDTCLYRSKQVKIVGFPEKESIWYSENDCMIEGDDTPQVIVDKRELTLWTSAGVVAWSPIGEFGNARNWSTALSVYHAVPRTGFKVTHEYLQAVSDAMNSKSGVFWLADSDGASPYDGWDKALAAGIAHSQNPEMPTLLMYGDRDSDVLICLFHNGKMFIPGELFKNER